MTVPSTSWLVANESMARAVMIGTSRFSPFAAIVSTTIVTISRTYGFSSPLSFGPAGWLGFVDSGSGGRVCLVSHGPNPAEAGSHIEAVASDFSRTAQFANAVV